MNKYIEFIKKLPAKYPNEILGPEKVWRLLCEEYLKNAELAKGTMDYQNYDHVLLTQSFVASESKKSEEKKETPKNFINAINHHFSEIDFKNDKYFYALLSAMISYNPAFLDQLSEKIKKHLAIENPETLSPSSLNILIIKGELNKQEEYFTDAFNYEDEKKNDNNNNNNYFPYFDTIAFNTLQLSSTAHMNDKQRKDLFLLNLKNHPEEHIQKLLLALASSIQDTNLRNRMIEDYIKEGSKILNNAYTEASEPEDDGHYMTIAKYLDPFRALGLLAISADVPLTTKKSVIELILKAYNNEEEIKVSGIDINWNIQATVLTSMLELLSDPLLPSEDAKPILQILHSTLKKYSNKDEQRRLNNNQMDLLTSLPEHLATMTSDAKTYFLHLLLKSLNDQELSLSTIGTYLNPKKINDLLKLIDSNDINLSDKLKNSLINLIIISTTSHRLDGQYNRRIRDFYYDYLTEALATKAFNVEGQEKLFLYLKVTELKTDNEERVNNLIQIADSLENKIDQEYMMRMLLEALQNNKKIVSEEIAVALIELIDQVSPEKRPSLYKQLFDLLHEDFVLHFVDSLSTQTCQNLCEAYLSYHNYYHLDNNSEIIVLSDAAALLYPDTDIISWEELENTEDSRDFEKIEIFKTQLQLQRDKFNKTYYQNNTLTAEEKNEKLQNLYSLLEKFDRPYSIITDYENKKSHYQEDEKEYNNYQYARSSLSHCSYNLRDYLTQHKLTAQDIENLSNFFAKYPPELKDLLSMVKREMKFMLPNKLENLILIHITQEIQKDHVGAIEAYKWMAEIPLNNLSNTAKLNFVEILSSSYDSVLNDSPPATDTQLLDLIRARNNALIEAGIHFMPSMTESDKIKLYECILAITYPTEKETEGYNTMEKIQKCMTTQLNSFFDQLSTLEKNYFLHCKIPNSIDYAINTGNFSLCCGLIDLSNALLKQQNLDLNIQNQVTEFLPPAIANIVTGLNSQKLG